MLSSKTLIHLVLSGLIVMLAVTQVPVSPVWPTG